MFQKNTIRLVKAIAIQLLILLFFPYSVRAINRLSVRESIKTPVTLMLVAEAEQSLPERNYESHQERTQNLRENQRTQTQRYRYIRTRQEEQFQRHEELKKERQEIIQPPAEIIRNSPETH